MFPTHSFIYLESNFSFLDDNVQKVFLGLTRLYNYTVWPLCQTGIKAWCSSFALEQETSLNIFRNMADEELFLSDANVLVMFNISQRRIRVSPSALTHFLIYPVSSLSPSSVSPVIGEVALPETVLSLQCCCVHLQQS